MTDRKLVSIIIPVYNNEIYLHACIESVIAQTYDNWEVLLVDDGSTDSSGIIADKYAEIYDKIHVLHQENLRVGAARNRGLEISSGEYITFLDSDDIAEKDWLETAVNVLEKTHSDLVQWENTFFKTDDANPFFCGREGERSGLYGRAKVTHCEMETNSADSLRVLLDERGRGSDDRFNFLSNSCKCVWTKMARKQLFEKIRFPEGKEFEDDFIVHHLFLASEKTVFINDELINKRTHSKSVLHSMNLKGHFDHLECAKDRMQLALASGEKDLMEFGTHHYFISLMNLDRICSNIEKNRELHEICRRDYKEFCRNMYMIDRLLIKGYCMFPGAVRRIYNIYRTKKDDHNIIKIKMGGRICHKKP